MKWFLASKTIWGAVLAAAPIFMPILEQQFGVKIDLQIISGQSEVIEQNLDKIVGAIGAIMVALDRCFSSHKKLTVLPEKVWPPRSKRR